MLTKQHIEEDLSKAYVQAVAAKAAVNLRIGDRTHDYTIDGTFHQITYMNRSRHESGFSIDFQLKATKNLMMENDIVKYDLDAETYNYLVNRANTPRTTPAILIILSLPKDEQNWLTLSEEELILRRCCYWIALEGAVTDNSSSKRIEIPKANLLTPDLVNELLCKIEAGRGLL